MEERDVRFSSNINDIADRDKAFGKAWSTCMLDTTGPNSNWALILLEGYGSA
jgi:hypothetical protein